MRIQGGRHYEQWMVSIKTSKRKCFLIQTLNLNKYWADNSWEAQIWPPQLFMATFLLIGQCCNWVDSLDLHTQKRKQEQHVYYVYLICYMQRKNQILCIKIYICHIHITVLIYYTTIICTKLAHLLCAHYAHLCYL